MSQTFSRAVATSLLQDRVWELFGDIQNWKRCSSLYQDLRWYGQPWAVGSSISAQLVYPISIGLRYVIRRYEPKIRVHYLAHGMSAGFATERRVEFQPTGSGTLIRIESYGIGNVPSFSGGMPEFLRSVCNRFFEDFARFCDEVDVAERPAIGPSRAIVAKRASGSNGD